MRILESFDVDSQLHGILYMKSYGVWLPCAQVLLLLLNQNLLLMVVKPSPFLPVISPFEENPIKNPNSHMVIVGDMASKGHVNRETRANSSTSVVSVAKKLPPRTVTGPSVSTSPSLPKLPTPVNADRLKSLLIKYNKSQELVVGFSSGFSLGISGEIIPAIDTPENHKSARESPGLVLDKLVKEINKGRIAGPFNQLPFPDLIISPLGLIPKKEPGKYRLIHNLSYPEGNSVNSLIPQEFSAVQYETIEHAIDLVRGFGKGCLMAKADIEDAFRLLPIHPSQYKYLGFLWDKQYYFDKCLPMGCSSSCQLFEKLSCALQWYMTHHHQASMSHLLDDFFFAGPPLSSKCKVDLEMFFKITEYLGIPIKHEKTQWPSTEIIIYGIQLNSISMTATLPQDKLEKAHGLINSFKNKKRIQLKDLQQIIGFLNFCCIVIVPGRAFLRRLIDLTVGVRYAHYFIRLNNEARADLQAWSLFLEHFNGKAFFLFEKWISSDTIKLYSDAAGVHGGYAAVLGVSWFVGHWTDQFHGVHITVKELFPIVLALEIFGLKLANHRILFLCDNQAVVEIINKMSSKENTLMKLVRRLVLATLKFNIQFRAKHIPGSTNVVADKLSRFQFQEARKLAPWLNLTPVSIPPHLVTL